MWAFLYEIGFWLTVTALVAWVFVAAEADWRRRLVWLFLAGIGSWGASWLFGVWGLGFKLWVAARDLFAAALMLLAATFVKRAPKAHHWLGWLIVPLAFVFYHDNLRATFAERPRAENDATGRISLDPQGELLVEIAESATADMLKEVVAPYGATVTRAFHPAAPQRTTLDAWYVLDLPDEQAALAVKRVLEATKGVRWVEENELIQVVPLHARPAPAPRHALGVDDPEADKQWGLEAIGMARAYALLAQLEPKRTARIAILDSGIDAQHEDLQAQYVSQGPRHDRDVLGHGTHCAGIAGAVTNNGTGIAGPAPKKGFVEITSFKVLSDNGTGSQRSIIDGMIKAVDAGADVISLSLGGPTTSARQRAYAEAVRYAAEEGVVVVAAAGNAGSDARRYSPANVPGLIAVAAVDTNLQRASFSNHVTQLDMAVAAPGTAIHSTLPGHRYAPLSGTSMAAPFVAGVLGLMKALEPELSTREAWQILHHTGRPTSDTRATGRLIQVDRALERLLEKR